MLIVVCSANSRISVIGKNRYLIWSPTKKGNSVFIELLSGLPRIVMSTENYVEQRVLQSTLATPQALNPGYKGRYPPFSYKGTVRTLIFIKVSSLQADSSNKMKTFG